MLPGYPAGQPPYYTAFVRAYTLYTLSRYKSCYVSIRAGSYYLVGELPGRRVGERDGAQCGKLRSAQRQWLGMKGGAILSPNTPTHA